MSAQPIGNLVSNKSTLTVGNLIRMYLAEVSNPGKGRRYVLNALLKMPFANKRAGKLRPADYLEHCRERRKTVSAPTVAQDLVHWKAVLVYARVVWEMADVSLAPLVDVTPILRKERLVGSSRVRFRRPTPLELEQLRAHFKAAKFAKIPMADIIEFSYESGRRISETCRITWGDYDPATSTVWVRDVKHPSKKEGNDKKAALLPRANEIIQAQPRRTNKPDERIFPYNAQSISSAFTRACNALSIEGLRLHDNRGECATRMLEEGYSIPEIQLVTLHDDAATLLKRYANRLRPEDLRFGPASKRTANA